MLYLDKLKLKSTTGFRKWTFLKMSKFQNPKPFLQKKRDFSF